MNTFLWLALLLIVVWLLARVFLAVTGAMLHLLWIVGIILLIVWAVRKISA
jgi:hypothetical protein